MFKLKTLLVSAKLRQHTFYKAKIRNVTRWTKTFEMLQRHVCLHDYLPQICDDEVKSFLLNPAQKRKWMVH